MLKGRLPQELLVVFSYKLISFELSRFYLINNLIDVFISCTYYYVIVN